MNHLTDALAHLPPTAVYTVLALAVFAESVLLLGTFTPTLALLLTAGAMARTGAVHLLPVIAAATAAAVAGDRLAHWTGHLLGERLRTGRLGRQIPAGAWQQAETLMTRHAGRSVFIGRFLPVVRTLTPHLAGATRLPYRRIAPYSATAAVLWAAAEAGIGYSAATSLQQILTVGGPALAAVALTALATTLWWRRSRRSARGAATIPRGHPGRKDEAPVR
ncbi:DedA family protein [Streptomyces sp. NPDC002669]|uniref:DedA family protein n=1 Tax=Streptomyces sp. NPDC002669 TaxID=3364658 RepID=UPI003690088F